MILSHARLPISTLPRAPARKRSGNGPKLPLRPVPLHCIISRAGLAQEPGCHHALGKRIRIESFSSTIVIPDEGGIQNLRVIWRTCLEDGQWLWPTQSAHWIPASAGMTAKGGKRPEVFAFPSLNALSSSFPLSRESSDQDEQASQMNHTPPESRANQTWRSLSPAASPGLQLPDPASDGHQ